jgi:hypothetical protein
MGKPQNIGDVDIIKDTVERPGDRDRLEDTVRSNDNNTASVTGSGASETDLVTNNSSGNWYLEAVTFSAAGAGGNVLAYIVRVKDTNGNVITGGTGHDRVEFDGAVVKPGWKITYEVLQSDSTSYTVNIWPVIRKTAPGEYGTGSEGSTGPVVIDDFEDNGISEYSGDTGDFSVVSSDTYQGSYSLEPTTDGTLYDIYSESGLGNYPEPGDTFRFNLKSQASLNESGSEKFRFEWAVDDSAGYSYGLEHRQTLGQFALVTEDSGSFDFTATSSQDLSVESDEWLEYEITWGEDTITATLIDSDGNALGSLSMDRGLSEANEGTGIAWKSSADEAAKFDYARIV